MREDLLAIQAPSTLFGFLNWALLFVAAAIIFYVFLRHRYIFVKPSMSLLVFTHVLLQWPCTLLSGFYETYLPDPFILILIVHLYVIVGLAISFLLFHQTARQIWEDLPKPLSVLDLKVLDRSIFLLVLLLAGLLAIYFSYVPIRETGLYAVLFDPIQSTMAREESLKLLDSALPKYAYSIMLNGVSPLIISLVTCRLLLNRFSVLPWVISLLVAGVVFVSVAVTGARAGQVMMLLTAILTYLFFRGFKVNFLLIASLLVLALFPAVLMTYIREGKDVVAFLEYMLEYFVAVGNRALIVPLEVGVWHVHYAQTEGIFIDQIYPWLVENNRPTAVNLPRLVGSIYVQEFYGKVLETTTAPAGYIFSAYMKAGLLSFPLSLLGLLLLDLVVVVLARLSRGLLLTGVATLSIGTLTFTHSEYTTVLLTHGFGVKLALLVGISVLISSFYRKIGKSQERRGIFSLSGESFRNTV